MRGMGIKEIDEILSRPDMSPEEIEWGKQIKSWMVTAQEHLDFLESIKNKRYIGDPAEIYKRLYHP